MAIKASSARMAKRASVIRAGAATPRPRASIEVARPNWRARTVMFRHPIKWFRMRYLGYKPSKAASAARKLFTPQTEEARRQGLIK